MNITFGRKKGLIYVGIIFFFSAILACEKKNIPFKEELAESFTDIILIDTLTPLLSTYKVDSFPSSGTGSVLVGGYHDPVFGKIVASSYFQLALPVYNIPSDAIFDSLTFIMRRSGEYYGDTLVQQQINVYELDAAIALGAEETQFFNNKSLPFKPVALGSRQISPRPTLRDSIEIRLSDTRGSELFSNLQLKTENVSNQENFLRYFRGILLKSEASPAVLMSYPAIDTSLKMRLYYRERGVNFVERYIDFPVTNQALQFNRIEIDRTGTPLQNLPPGNVEIPSASLNNAAYVQFATGLMARVSFPYLQNLLNIDPNGRILRADLVVKPLEGSYPAPFELPPTLNLSITDRTNVLGSVIGTGNLSVDEFFGENTGHTIDITSFLQDQININVVNQNGVLIYSPTRTAFNRMIIGNQATGRSRLQVRIFYLQIN